MNARTAPPTNPAQSFTPADLARILQGPAPAWSFPAQADRQMPKSVSAGCDACAQTGRGFTTRDTGHGEVITGYHGCPVCRPTTTTPKDQ
jgi:hypothetical protein